MKGADMSQTRPTFDHGKRGASQELAWPSALRDFSALEAELVEKIVSGKLNVIEKARAYAKLSKELGLTYQQIEDRVGCHKATVANLVRLLALSDEILELVVSGKLSEAHGRALLSAKDPQARGELAREAIEKGWSTRELQARARESNEDAPGPRRGPIEDEQDPGVAIQAVAEAWGELLGVEVHVRTMAHGCVRLEVLFTSAQAARALPSRLSEAASIEACERTESS
jgi:ParB family transcriptional regulator, chromosome partitioning protein